MIIASHNLFLCVKVYLLCVLLAGHRHASPPVAANTVFTVVFESTSRTSKRLQTEIGALESFACIGNPPRAMQRTPGSDLDQGVIVSARAINQSILRDKRSATRSEPKSCMSLGGPRSTNTTTTETLKHSGDRLEASQTIAHLAPCAQSVEPIAAQCRHEQRAEEAHCSEVRRSTFGPWA